MFASFVMLPTKGYAAAPAISASQAAAYAQVIQNATRRLTEEFGPYDSEYEEPDLYVTTFSVEGNTLLWVCGICVENREAEWPLDIQFGNGCFHVIFEEIWEWNGEQAVRFPIMSYDSYANLRANGLEVYTCYGGTDVDGEAWDAFYPFVNGKISAAPDWCRAWAWVYDYKLEELGLPQSGTDQSISEAYFKKLAELNCWPALPFDWSTVSTAMSFGAGDFRAEVTGGSGYQSLYTMDEFDYAWPSVKGDPNVLLCAADIADQDGMWIKAAEAIDVLTQYSLSATGGFVDVRPDAYYVAPVLWAVENNITTGTSSTTFSPNNTCSNAQILTFIWRANGSPAPNIANPFFDVSPSDYYYKAALWAYEKGIVSGNIFHGDANCTRSMAVTYLWENAGSPNMNDEIYFEDVSSDMLYAPAISWAVKNGITTGTNATTFSPNSTCTRGQIVTFLYRASGQAGTSAS